MTDERDEDLCSSASCHDSSSSSSVSLIPAIDELPLL
jgi:hypothetical protein